MQSFTATDAPKRRAQRIAGWTIFTLAVVCAMAAWWMLSAYFFVLKCDESCGGSDPDHWEYTAQAIWVGAASVTALAGIFLGIRGRLHAFALLFSLAVTAAVAWFSWAWSGGFQG